MQRIALTGGIAAGKSVAAARLAEWGAVVVDYDLLSRQAVEPGSVGLDQVVAAFGPQVLAPDGTLDRAAVAALVFSDDDARTRLNAVVHPVVHRLAAEAEAAAATADPDAVVVHDIPLLAESDWAEAFGLVVLVHTPALLRVERLVELRGMTRQDAEARIAAQATDEQRLALADVVLDGSGDPAGLRGQVDELWDRLVAERAAEHEEPQ